MTDFFKNIPLIKYEGRSSTNDFAFHYYNPDEVIGDQTMKDHLRFAASYWHTFQGDGSDPFGAGTMRRPWDGVSDPMSLAQIKVEAALEFMEKLGLEYFCFHDLDLAPEGTSFQERNHNLDVIVAHLKAQLKNTSIKVLWGTSNTFTHPRFVHGAATSCDAKVFACTAAQIKKALEITKELGGENYVFWGGREGYETLLNTDTALELDNYARLLRMAVDYAAEIEFRGPLLIEPKPKEPTKHQYDFDVMTVLAFLRKYHLDKHFKLNIEANHATLAGHTFQHELNLARINNVLGSVDVNQGDLLLGWDTDQFPTNLYDAVLAMSEILQNGGIAPGGLNFDAKVRRGSFSPEALVKAYLAGMDTLAQGLRIAYKINQDGVFEEVIRNRYHSYREGLGKDIIEGRVGFVELEKYILAQGHIEPDSSSQEHLERMLNHYLLES